MSEKTKVLACITAAIVLLSGAFYVSHHTNKNCISYYNKDSTKLLYKDCS